MLNVRKKNVKMLQLKILIIKLTKKLHLNEKKRYNLMNKSFDFDIFENDRKIFYELKTPNFKINRNEYEKINSEVVQKMHNNDFAKRICKINKKDLTLNSTDCITLRINSSDKYKNYDLNK